MKELIKRIQREWQMWFMFAALGIMLVEWYWSFLG
jgi:hypothetical protein